MADVPKMARIYIRVSTEGQDLTRQAFLQDAARAAGFYIAAIYAEKASGATLARPELQRMLADLQPGDVIIAEHVDRLSRLTITEAEQLIATIRSKGAVLAIPGLVDLTDIVASTEGMARIVLEAMQALLLKMALQMARADFETRRSRQLQGIAVAKARGVYTGRKPNIEINNGVRRLLESGLTVAATARQLGCSESHVKRIRRVMRDAAT